LEKYLWLKPSQKISNNARKLGGARHDVQVLASFETMTLCICIPSAQLFSLTGKADAVGPV
jgi:hypothetical protein